MNRDPAPGVDNTVTQGLPPAPGSPGPTGLGETLLRRQRDDWLRGERVPVEALVGRHPELAANEETLLDLIYHEFLLRKEIGDRPRPEEYFERFPRQRESLRRQLELDEAVMGDAASAGADDSPAGRGRVGKYPLIALLGEGGQAVVYRAVHPELGRDVVIKLAKADRPASAAERDRLRQEGRILTELEHPNLARVYDLDVDGGRPFLVMEYVRGRSLDRYAADEKPSPRAAAALVAGLARALAVVHEKGVLHLDVKPRNVLIDEAGTPRLIDFGLARQRQWWTEEPADAGDVSGTLAFMAPEQARGETARLGPASDVFALGGVLYFLLTGRALFTGPTFSEVLRNARSCAFDRAALNSPRIPRRLARVCLRALEADPEARYARAADLAADLEAMGRRPRGWVWFAAAAAVVLTALLGLTVWRPGGSGAPAPARDPGVAAPARTAAATPALSLHVRVWDHGRYLDLPKAAPLRTGDSFQVVVEAPPELHVGLFLFTSTGDLKLLADRAPAAGRGDLHFPAGEDEAVPLTGRPGAEFLLACGRRSGPVGLAELRSVWPAFDPWPALPGESVLRLRPDEVTVEQRGRDVGSPVVHVDPEGAVRRRMEELRSKLRGQFESFEGIAFAHED